MPLWGTLCQTNTAIRATRYRGRFGLWGEEMGKNSALFVCQQADFHPDVYCQCYVMVKRGLAGVDLVATLPAKCLVSRAQIGRRIMTKMLKAALMATAGFAIVSEAAATE